MRVTAFTMSDKTMRAAVVPSAGAGRLELRDVPVPEPGFGEVRIKVEACGVCHSDALTVHNAWPGIAYPRVPGHEIAGTIDALGPQKRASGSSASALARLAWRPLQLLPSLPPRRFRPLRKSAYLRHQLRRRLCRLRHRSGQRPRLDSRRPLRCRRRAASLRRHHDLQRTSQQRRSPRRHCRHPRHRRPRPSRRAYAAKSGFRTVAVARGRDKESLARSLGAMHYLDSQTRRLPAPSFKNSAARDSFSRRSPPPPRWSQRWPDSARMANCSSSEPRWNLYRSIPPP